MWCQASPYVGDPDVWETTERHDDAACIKTMHLSGG